MDLLNNLFAEHQKIIGSRSTPEHNPTQIKKKLQNANWRVTGFKVIDTDVKKWVAEGKPDMGEWLMDNFENIEKFKDETLH